MKHVLDLTKPEETLAWVDAFRAKTRADGLVDEAATETNPAKLAITNSFVGCCGTETIMKLKSLLAPRELFDVP